MQWMLVALLCLFYGEPWLHSRTRVIASRAQDIELDDVTSLWGKFPSIIDKIKETGMLLGDERHSRQGQPSTVSIRPAGEESGHGVYHAFLQQRFYIFGGERGQVQHRKNELFWFEQRKLGGWHSISYG